MHKGRVAALLAWAVCAAACGGGSGSGNSVTCAERQAQLETAMTGTLSGAATDTDFTLLLQRADGHTFSWSRGTSTPDQAYDSASTSKLVTAVVILELIDRGTTSLTLDSRPGDFLAAADWPAIPGTNPASGITLRHLLGFTSGFMTEPPPAAGDLLGCLDKPGSNIHACVRAIYDVNIGNNITPGSRFHYSSTHLQVAGLMAVEAAGYSNWNELFADFTARTGLFAHSTYQLPSSTNPRLAGGMVWTAADYLQFLEALSSGNLLSAPIQAQLWANQRGSATVVYSPIVDKMGEDWGYGLGNWIECTSAAYDCGTTRRRNSSPGAYGAYPFIDFENRYFGILARQGALGTFPNGIDLFRTVEPTAAQWAALTCP